jgi:hypothetical protein
MLDPSRRRSFLSKLLLAMGGGSAAAFAQGTGPNAARSISPGSSGLGSLFLARDARRRRTSSWNRTGQNGDRVYIEPGASATLLDVAGAGCIRHIWVTINCMEPDYLRRLVLRAWWDGERAPSVETPLGDFFGVGHARVSNYWSLPLNMVTGGRPLSQTRAAMNCFFPMPFAKGARVAVENQGSQPVLSLYYYVDYEEYRALPAEALRFHAAWRRENPTHPSVPAGTFTNKREADQLVNLDGKQNYLLLDAEGRGQYVGCVLSIDHLDPIPGFGWFGEGDDMIFIDGETSPSIVGTGTEDYFCAAWSYPAGHNSMPYHGISLAGPTEGPTAYSGKWSMYRFHIEDPVQFSRSIRVTIEHGHANVHASDFSSVAYWYQTEPHRPYEALLPVAQRLPIGDAESLRRFQESFSRK